MFIVLCALYFSYKICYKCYVCVRQKPLNNYRHLYFQSRVFVKKRPASSASGRLVIWVWVTVRRTRLTRRRTYNAHTLQLKSTRSIPTEVTAWFNSSKRVQRIDFLHSADTQQKMGISNRWLKPSKMSDDDIRTNVNPLVYLCVIAIFLANYRINQRVISLSLST